MTAGQRAGTRDVEPRRPLVAVLLAVYNGERFLEQQLASLLWQQNVDIHVYCADDGSVDRTMEIVRGLAATDSRIREITGPRMGSAARNFARLLTSVELSSYDFVALCDQDDVWMPGKLRHAIDSMEVSVSHCYASNLIAFDDRGNISLVEKHHPQRALDYMFQSASAACTYVLTAAAATIAKNTIGPSYVEWPVIASLDCIIYAATRSRGMNWFIDPAPQVMYRQHSANVDGANIGIAALTKRIRYVRSGWIGAQVSLISRYLPDDVRRGEVVRRLRHPTLRNRLWLAIRVGEFRREATARMALALFFLLGWI